MNPDSSSDSFLPGFCSLRQLLYIAAIAELLAIILTLGPDCQQNALWVALGNISLFTQAVALSSVALLCAASRSLRRLTPRHAGIIAFLVAPLLTLLLSSISLLWMSYLSPQVDSIQAPSDIGSIFRHVAISAIVSFVALSYGYVYHQSKRNLEIQSRARIQALQARIRPHFLFNSLNTIASLIESRPAQAEAAVEDLADLFRANLEERSEITLAEELNIAHRYIHIETLRIGDRLKVRWEFDPPKDAIIPALILQPLIENAIYHGIQPMPEGGEILIEGRLERERLLFSVSNPVFEDKRYGGHVGNRMAQENIRQRLHLAYGSAASMEIEDTVSNYKVTIILPYKTAANEKSRP